MRAVWQRLHVQKKNTTQKTKGVRGNNGKVHIGAQINPEFPQNTSGKTPARRKQNKSEK